MNQDIHPVSRAFLFLGEQKFRRNFLWLPLTGMILCIILGVFHPLKKKLPYEEFVPGSWALYGVVAMGLIYLLRNVFFALLARDEAYYGEGGLPDPDVPLTPQAEEGSHD